MRSSGIFRTISTSLRTRCEDKSHIIIMTICASLDCLHGSAYPICNCWNGNNPLLLASGEDGMLVTTQWRIEVLWFVDKLKSPKHSVNGNKIENTENTPD